MEACKVDLAQLDVRLILVVAHLQRPGGFKLEQTESGFEILDALQFHQLP